MFQQTSRYNGIPTAAVTVTALDGTPRTISYVLRRFIPQAASIGTLVEVAIVQGDRLDNITARYLGDPEQFWRIADANNAMNPNDLVAVTGAVLRVPIPQFQTT